MELDPGASTVPVPQEKRSKKASALSCIGQTNDARHRYAHLAARLSRCSASLFAAEAIPCMTRITRRNWTPDQINLLFELIEKGASPARASVALRRPKLAVQNKARQLGRPFQDVRDVKAARLARGVSELQA